MSITEAVIDCLPPLIPSESIPPYADVAPVLRQAFQDIIGLTDSYENQNPFSLNKAESLSRDEITKAEYNIMMKQAEYLVCQNILEENFDIMERMHLRRPKLIASPQDDYREKFHLLKADDLKGRDFERYFGCPTSSFSLFDVDLRFEDPLSKMACKVPENILIKRCGIIKKDNLKRMEVSQKIANMTNTSDILEIKPSTILFRNYEPFVKCVKVLRLRNKTNRGVRFFVRPLLTSQFQVELENIAPIVPPGLPVYIKIHFKGVDRIGCKTELYIYIQNCKDLIVDLIASRDPPILKGVVLDADFDLRKTASDISDVPRQTDIEKVLNRSIDCGSCLLGDFKEVMLLVKNIGGTGRFFIVSEEDWYGSTVNNVTTDGFLMCPPFCMYPVYFSVNPGCVAALQTFFLPRICGAHVERVLIICDNCTIRGADLLGDGVEFSRNFINLDIPLKDYEITMDGDNDATNYIDFGDMALKTEKHFDFTITNVGPVELSFYWEARDPNIIWTSANPGIENLCIDDIKVAPVNGVIEANETINLKMTICACKYGNFRSCVALYVSDIPIESIVQPVPEKFIQRNSNTDVNKVNVMITLVEIWARCEPAKLTVNPGVFDISCGNITCDELEFTLKVQNHTNVKKDIGMGYCGPIEKKEPKVKHAPPKSKNYKLSLSNKRSKIPIRVQEIKVPCALMPSGTCTKTCPSKNTCKQAAERALSKISQHTPTVRKTVLLDHRKHKEQLREDEKEAEFVCVAPKNFIGVDRTISYLKPIQAMSESSNSLRLKVNLKFDGCQKTHERFVFYTIDNSAVPQAFDVKVVSRKHCLELSKTLIDFGEVKCATRRVESFCIKKTCFAPLCWTLREYQYNFNTFAFEVCTEKNVSQNRGKFLKPADSIEIKYSLQTKRYGIMLGILEIKCWKKMKDVCEFYFVILRAVVHQPMLSISIRDRTNSPFLNIPERLFIGITSTHQIIFRNNGKIPLSFMWSKPIGDQAYDLSVKISNRADILQPNEVKVLDIKITPKNVGVIDRIFLPCFIGRFSNPLVLNVRCFVDSLRVSFSVPVDVTAEKSVVKTYIWTCPEENKPEPPLPDDISSTSMDDISDISAQEALQLGQLKVGELSPELEVRVHNLEGKLDTTRSVDSDIGKYTNIEKIRQTYFQNNVSRELYSTIKESYWKYLYVEGILTHAPTLSSNPFEVSQKLNTDRLSDILYDDSVSALNISSTEIAPLASCKDIFKTDDVIVMKVLNLQTKHTIQKTIVLKNLSPISTTFNVKINYYKISKEINSQALINNINAKIHGRPNDEWSYRIPQGQGLLIHPLDENEVILQPDSCYDIKIIFYANTWGFYNDILTIRVSDLQPFHIPITVVATGYPIQIPISINNNIPIIDFGTYSEKDIQMVKRFPIKNICDIPIKLSWHCFMDKSSPADFITQSELFPFNIVLDIYDDLIDEHLKTKKYKSHFLGEGMDVVLTNYYGTEVFKEFIVEPAIAEIMPGKTMWFTVTFQPKYFKPDVIKENTDAECCMVAFIRIRDTDKFANPRMLRTDGSIFEPLLLFGHVHSEIKSVTIEIVTCESLVGVSAMDVMSSCSQNMKVCQKFIIKNTGDAASINIITEEPYKMILIKSQHLYTELRATEVDVQAQRSEILEVTLEATIELTHLLAAWLRLQNTNKLPLHRWRVVKIPHSTILHKPVTIKAGMHLKQTLTMDIEIFFPDMELCSEEYVNFGPVFIGDTATRSIILRNRSNCKIDFRVEMKYKSQEFVLVTKSGVVNPVIGNNIYSTMVYVTFTPKQCKKYSSVAEILTCLPFYNFQIYLSGFGTNDSKFRILETIVS